MKRKVILSLVLSVVLTFMNLTFVSAEGVKYYDYYKVVNLFIGEKQAMVNSDLVTMDQPAYVKDGRTLVPFRFLGESLGSEVEWDEAKKQATLTLDNNEVKVVIDSKVAYVNGQLTKLDVPAEIKGGRTFIPLRFVSEALGAYVDYFGDEERIQIRYASTKEWKVFKLPDGSETPYKYPVDWSALEEDGIISFVSPNGSQADITYWDVSVQEIMKDLEQYAPDNGITFISEEYFDDQDPAKGVCLTYSQETDDPNNPLMSYIYLSETDNHLTYVVWENILDSNVEMDWVVMSEIVDGYWY